jgi:putative FmdB family regulatory protein
MPSYDYRCDGCEVIWDEFHSISSRDNPCDEKCPHCGEMKVSRHIGNFPQMKTDTTMTANKKTGGQWNELMTRMKDYTPERYHKKFDTATSRTGRRFKG